MIKTFLALLLLSSCIPKDEKYYRDAQQKPVCMIRFKDWEGGVWVTCEQRGTNELKLEYDRYAVWVKCEGGKRWRVTSNVEYSEGCHD